MYKVSVDKLRQGMIVAQDINNVYGMCMLRRGTVLDENYIERLKKIGIYGVYIAVTKRDLEELMPKDIVRDRTRLQAIKSVFSAFNQFEVEGFIDFKDVKRSSKQIIKDLSRKKDNLVQINDIRAYDQYTFSHSVNVSVLSTIIGMEVGLDKDTLDELALGALLHDIGKTKVPSGVLNKRERLSMDELNIMKRHPEDGAHILMMMPQFSMEILNIVSQHHESCDGLGYPYGLTASQISWLAKIVSIADVYDALTSDRVYKVAYSPAVAYNIMNNIMAAQFDKALLAKFFSNIAVFPIGSVVKLNTGEYAVVRDVDKHNVLRPLVDVVVDADGRRLQPFYKCDLRVEDNIIIDKTLEEKDAMLIYKEVGDILK